MKILFVTPQIPHPIGGGASRMYYQLKYLKQENISVDLFSYADSSGNLPDEIKETVNRFYSIPKPTEGPFQRFVNFSTARAYTRDKKLLNLIEKVIGGNKYNLIHVHKFQMAEYFLDIKDIPVVIDLWACGLKGAWYEVVYEPRVLKKLIKLTRIPRFYLADIKFYTNFKYFFVVSNEAKEYISERYPEKKVYVIPNGIEIERFFEVKARDNKNLIFTGDMSFFQNVDTVLYFIKKIYPKMKNVFKDIKFFIVGKNPSKKIIEIVKKDPSIIVTGYVDSISEYLQKCSLFVAPIRSGLGIRNKILEALASGIAVVATKNACEGIDIKDNVNVALADTPEEFAAKVITLLNNSEMRLKIGENARKIIEEKYQWKDIVRKMVRYYYEILNSYNLER